MDPDKATCPARQPVTPLQRLILDVRETGLSYRQLVIRSRRSDGTGGLSHGRLHQLATRPIRRGLDEGSREALARALRVPLPVVQEAVSRSVGNFVDQNVADFETRHLLAQVAVLPPQSRDRWYRLARAIAESLAAEGQ
jgi:hypothetical protein